MKALIKEAVAAFDPRDMAFNKHSVKIMLKNALPIFKNDKDLLIWVASNYQPMKLMRVLVPEPSNEELAELINVHRGFPSSTEFFGTALYFMYKVLKLGKKM